MSKMELLCNKTHKLTKILIKEFVFLTNQIQKFYQKQLQEK